MDWQSLIHNTAFPIVATVALAFVVYKIANTFFTDVYVPMQMKHNHLVEKLEMSLDKTNENIEKVAEMIDKVLDKLKEHEDRISRIEQRVS